ncbi:MAG: CoA transferase [Alphaproteobacteria bacterium]|nr:CoA transferase [Alphaproteobacteria bacterium]
MSTPASDAARASAIAALAGVAGPLAGTLVLELCGDEPSGTFGTQMLADLGATVVKIERPPADEPAPTAPPAPGTPVSRDIAYTFGLNRNKRSLCLDLKQAEGRAVFHALAAVADIVYDNYRPGVTARLGADAEALRRVNPHIICCSVSGFGHTGPWSQLSAYDATVQALGGGMSITGTGKPEDPPVRWGNPIGGIGGALYAVLGVLVALRRRRAEGHGSALDIALLDAQLAMHAYRVPPAHGGVTYSAQPFRGGSGALPYGPFRARCGHWFVLGITAQFWATACKVFGRPEWAEDPRFRTEKDRQANEAVLNVEVTKAMLTEDADEWQRRFVAAGIPGAKVASIEEAFSHPHVALRDMLVSFDHPIGARLKVAGSPVKLSAHPHAGYRAAPGLGADTQAILRELLGKDADAAEALRARRALWWPRAGEVHERPSVV